MLQEFVWSEEQRADRTEQRRRRMQALGEDDAHMPLFSFQTAIKSFYFAALIYEYQEVKSSRLDMSHHKLILQAIPFLRDNSE